MGGQDVLWKGDGGALTVPPRRSSSGPPSYQRSSDEVVSAKYLVDQKKMPFLLVQPQKSTCHSSRYNGYNRYSRYNRRARAVVGGVGRWG